MTLHLEYVNANTDVCVIKIQIFYNPHYHPSGY